MAAAIIGGTRSIVPPYSRLTRFRTLTNKLRNEGSVQALPEQRKELLQLFAGISDEIKILIILSRRGICPFCFAQEDVASPIAQAIKRGFRAEALKAEVERLTQEAIAVGIDPETGHAVDCAYMVMAKSIDKITE
jgi:hypothetical protein